MHINFPQRECNSLRFNKLTLSPELLGKSFDDVSVQRYKNEGKWQNKLLFIFEINENEDENENYKLDDNQDN